MTPPPPRRAFAVRDVVAALDGGGSELEQALRLVRAAGRVEEPGRLTLGELDAELLAEHDATFGPGLEAVAVCAGCGTRNAFPLDAETLHPPFPRSGWQAPGAGLSEPLAEDLLGLPGDPGHAAAELAARCAVGPDPGGRDPDLLGEVDTGLHGGVTGACVECGLPVRAPLDVAASVLAHFAALSAAYDAEVHQLAARYGWTLEAIEALPDARRRRLAEYAGARA